MVVKTGILSPRVTDSPKSINADPLILFDKNSVESISHVITTGPECSNVFIEAFNLDDVEIVIQRVGGPGSGEWFNNYRVLTGDDPLVRLAIPGRWRAIVKPEYEKDLGKFFVHVVGL